MKIYNLIAGGSVALFLLGATAGCSIYMENTRPAPVQLAKFSPGMSREDVLAQVGTPVNTSPGADGASCDLYRLYTRGYGAAGKVPITVAEAAADFFTIGLAEIVLTPTEAMTKNDLHPVDFCYKDQKLVSVNERPASGAVTDNPPVTAAQAASSPPAASTTAAVASPAASATQVASVSAAAGGAPAMSASPSASPSQAALAAGVQPAATSK